MVIGGKPVLRTALELTKDRPQRSMLAIMARMGKKRDWGCVSGVIGAQAIPQAGGGVKATGMAGKVGPKIPHRRMSGGRGRPGLRRRYSL
jgi:hypothetical protein